MDHFQLNLCATHSVLLQKKKWRDKRQDFYLNKR